MKNSCYKKTLVLGIIVLLIGIAVAPSTAKLIDTKISINHKLSSIPLINRKIIYVDDNNTEGPWDGTIEHPYQYIKQGVNNANNSDTVFVFSGYYPEGAITIEKSINIIGEDKNTTIVDGYGYYVVFLFKGYNVKLSGFTIQNAYQYNRYGSGVCIYSSNHIICGNIIQNNACTGIGLDWSHNNHIYDNIIRYNGLYSPPLHDHQAGISGWASDNNIIEYNIFENNNYGIYFLGSWGGDTNFICNNVIKNSSKAGIFLARTNKNEIKRNHIVKNYNGVILWNARSTRVTKNNIYNNNNLDAYFVRLQNNRWRNNYWGAKIPRIKAIEGRIQIPIGIDPLTFEFIYKNIDWIQYDWCPARNPYNINFSGVWI